MKNIKRIMQIDPWKIESQEIDKENRRLQESLTSIGNGYMGMRGNFSETYSADHHQGLYLAGIWYPDKTRVGWWKNGYPEYFGKAINAINFSGVRVFIDDEEVDLAGSEVTDFKLSLDMEKGILSYNYTFKSVRVSVERFFSIAQKELAVFAFMFENLEEAEHKVRVESTITADVYNEDANYDNEQFWEVLELNKREQGSSLAAQTIANPFGVEQFTVLACQNYAGNFQLTGQETDEKTVTDYLEYQLTARQVKGFEKRVLVTTSRDYASLEEMKQASQQIQEELAKKDYMELYQAQVDAWAERWAQSDVQIDGESDSAKEAQQGIRFNLFQLFSTYYGEDERLNIGPKGFTGEKYGGATYWDTEAYAMPLYLALADEKVSLNLLKYRRNQLEGAKHNARQQGLKGALYPMVTFNGIECHNEWEITFEEIHRNGAMAYAIYNYTNYTGDTNYIAHEGLEVLVEIARFWADRVHFSKRSGKYMIYGVTGPNEYENNVNNNWYTNTLAKWVLEYTLEALEKYPRNDLGVHEEEAEHWQDIINKIYLPEDKDLGIFVQNDGYLDKDLTPVADLAPENLSLNQNWSWDKILRSPYIKQADVLQGIYFFGNRYSLSEKSANFRFYEPLTVHESSLSASIHAILAAELSMTDKAVEMYERTARLDLDNYNNDTEDGLHITSMTGSWLAIVQGFAQMKTWDEKLSFAPFLPKEWDSYSFHVNYRGRLLKVTVNSEEVILNLLQGEGLKLSIYGNKIELHGQYVTELRKN